MTVIKPGMLVRIKGHDEIKEVFRNAEARVLRPVYEPQHYLNADWWIETFIGERCARTVDLEPVVDDGHKAVEWSKECPWTPEHLREDIKEEETV